MKTISGTAVTPFGICGFGYVDEGLPKEEALAKLKLEMQNNLALQTFLSKMPKEKQREILKDMITAIIGEPPQEAKLEAPQLLEARPPKD